MIHNEINNKINNDTHSEITNKINNEITNRTNVNIYNQINNTVISDNGTPSVNGSLIIKAHWFNKKAATTKNCDYAAAFLLKATPLCSIKPCYEKCMPRVTLAIEYIKEHHGNQKRQTGEPYYSHPLAVASMYLDHMNKKKCDANNVIAALLHDVIEDTDITKENINEMFGSEVASKVDFLTKKDGYCLQNLICKMLLLGKKGKSVLLIKLLDRIHNLQTIEVKSLKKRKKIINETSSILVPLAVELRLSQIAVQLQVLCTRASSSALQITKTLRTPTPSLVNIL